MKLEMDWYSDIGGKEINEDSVGVFESDGGTLCVVADGLGGHVHGEIASRTTVQFLGQHIGGDLSADGLQDVIGRANRELVKLSAGKRMSTTLAALWLSGGQALAATVGDTRIYQFRNGQIVFQSLDHSLAQLEMESEDCVYLDVRYHPARSMLLRAVGMETGFRSDVTSLEYRQGDAFLLCTDGFWDHIFESEMCGALQSAQTPQAWLEIMQAILGARQPDDCDNHTALAVMVTE